MNKNVIFIKNANKPIIKRLILNGLLFVSILGLLWFIALQPHQYKAVDSLYDKTMGNEIHSIIISHQTNIDKKTPISMIKLQKIDDEWSVTEPINVSINKQKIQHLLTLLSEPISASYPVRGKDLSLFGLDKERVSVSFNGIKIQFGTLNPISYKRYLRKGDTIYIVNETVYGLLVDGVDSLIQTHTTLSD